MSVFGHKLSKYAVVPMRGGEYEEGWVCCAEGNVKKIKEEIYKLLF